MKHLFFLILMMFIGNFFFFRYFQFYNRSKTWTKLNKKEINETKQKFKVKKSTTATLRNLTNHRTDCQRSDCYPPTKDLLLGRSKFLYASSTCGLTQPEYFCVLGSKKKQNSSQHTSSRCYACDSTNSSGRVSHRVENLIFTNQIRYGHRGRELPARWWQSENGKERVYIQFDLEAELTMTHLIMRFKSLPPAAMLIEKSIDYGRTWQVQAYYAADCEQTYPNVSTVNLKDLSKPYCTSKFSGLGVTTGGELYYAPLLQLSDKSIDRTRLQSLLRLTNLRFNFSGLHMLDDKPRNYYYAVNEIRVIGSCMCNGHASECLRESGIEYDSEHVNQMMHSRCKCQHKTG